MWKLIFSMVLIIAVNGCVPIINTYYAPSSENGALSSSSSCGPSDSIIIEESGVKVQLESSGNKAYLRVLPETENVSVDFSKVFITLQDGSIFQPIKVVRGEYRTSSRIDAHFMQTLRPENPYFFILHFDIKKVPDQFSIEINQIRIHQTIFSIPAVEFKKTSKPGIGYINC